MVKSCISGPVAAVVPRKGLGRRRTFVPVVPAGKVRVWVGLVLRILAVPRFAQVVPLSTEYWTGIVCPPAPLVRFFVVNITSTKSLVTWGKLASQSTVSKVRLGESSYAKSLSCDDKGRNKGLLPVEPSRASHNRR